MKNFHILSAIPDSFGYLEASIIGRARKKGLININIIDLREFGHGKWNKIDGRPFSGGPGMLFQVEPVVKAIQSLGFNPEYKLRQEKDDNLHVILTSPTGDLFNQNRAEQIAVLEKDILIICGHYEGFDYRVEEHLVDEVLSIGNYVLSGGELASMIIIDSVSRLISGVLGNELSPVYETKFDENVKVSEYPQYTRPSSLILPSGIEAIVPDILLSGNHGEIEKWKRNSEVKS
jgi:tRNA (guanine37-N1)-methyltransferase